MNQEIKDTIFGLLIVLGGMFVWGCGYFVGIHVPNGDCPSGYRCEKIDYPCDDERSSCFSQWREEQLKKHDCYDESGYFVGEMFPEGVFVYDNQTNKLSKIVYKNGTEIPRCEEGR